MLSRLAIWALLLGGIVCLGLQAPTRAYFQTRDSAYNNPVVAGGGTTTFDPSNKGSNITLSGGNLVATSTASSGTNTAVLSVASHSSGKYYLEYKFTVNVTPGSNGFGIANSSFLVASDEMGFATNNRSTATWNSSCFQAGGSCTAGGANGPIATNDVIAMAFDRTANLLWWKNLTSGNGWNDNAPGGSNDPATGVGGYDLTALGAGAYFFGVQLETNGNSVTVNTGGSAYVGTVPSGYGNW